MQRSGDQCSGSVIVFHESKAALCKTYTNARLDPGGSHLETRDMGLFRRKVPSNYIPVHPDNVRTKDWVILLEAGTIMGPSSEKLRVARATLEKRIVRKYNAFLRKQCFLVLEEYDPQIHAVYFCPQLYKFDSEGSLFPLDGEEIGKLLARSLRDGVVEKRPWYDPATKLQHPIISTDKSSHLTNPDHLSTVSPV